MNLKQKISDDMKTAMRAGDTGKRDAVRLLLAAIKQSEVDTRTELDDTAVIAIIDKMLKQRRDSIAQYETAQRQDLIEIEKYEMGVLTVYMPPAVSESDIDALVTETIASTGASSQKDMGKVMAILKPKLAGRADMAKVSSLVKKKILG